MVYSRENNNRSSKHGNLAVLKEDAHNFAEPDEVQSSPSWPYVTFDEFTGNPDKSGDNSSVSQGKAKSRRNRVYDDIIRQWKQRVHISDLPKPRPSHSRNSGVHAFSTRQVRRQARRLSTRMTSPKVLGSSRCSLYLYTNMLTSRMPVALRND